MQQLQETLFERLRTELNPKLSPFDLTQFSEPKEKEMLLETAISVQNDAGLGNVMITGGVAVAVYGHRKIRKSKTVDMFVNEEGFRRIVERGVQFYYVPNEFGIFVTERNGTLAYLCTDRMNHIKVPDSLWNEPYIHFFNGKPILVVPREFLMALKIARGIYLSQKGGKPFGKDATDIALLLTAQYFTQGGIEGIDYDKVRRYVNMHVCPSCELYQKDELYCLHSLPSPIKQLNGKEIPHFLMGLEMLELEMGDYCRANTEKF